MSTDNTTIPGQTDLANNNDTDNEGKFDLCKPEADIPLPRPKRRRRREYDYEQDKYVTIKNPRSEWEIYKDPSLALVPKELWRAAWLKLLRTRKAHPLTGKKPSRNQNSATTLFSGTLFCESCGKELRLNRSAGKYKVMSCLSGSTGVHDCPLGGRSVAAVHRGEYNSFPIGPQTENSKQK